MSEEAGDMPAGRESTKVIWNDENMQTTYANVVNVMFTREEVMLFFGTNKSSSLERSAQLSVELSDRMILNPHAAKRLLTMLAAAVAQYEKRHGKIDISLGETGQQSTQQPESE